MASRLTEVIIDCTDIDRLVEFWSEVLAYDRANAGDGWVALRAPRTEISEDALRTGALPPAVTLVGVREPKAGKNRVHLDITPVDRTQGEEVARLEKLGATCANIGQGQVAWVVMADPEGNEFCVMPEIDRDRA